jgi:PKD repeat protein
VKDSVGLWSEKVTVSVYVEENIAPGLIAGEDQEILENEKIFFSPQILEHDGEIAEYEWDFEGDGTYDWSSSDNGNTYFEYSKPGTFNPVIRVTDSDGNQTTDSITVKVIEAGLLSDPTSSNFLIILIILLLIMIVLLQLWILKRTRSAKDEQPSGAISGTLDEDLHEKEIESEATSDEEQDEFASNPAEEAPEQHELPRPYPLPMPTHLPPAVAAQIYEKPKESQDEISHQEMPEDILPQGLEEEHPSQELPDESTPKEFDDEPPTQRLQEEPPTQRLQEEPPTQELQEKPPTQDLQEEPPTQELQEDTPAEDEDASKEINQLPPPPSHLSEEDPDELNSPE